MRIVCIILLFALSGWECGDAGLSVPSPPGYDLGNPRKFLVGESLHEISGITFIRPNNDSLYAIEDEDGKLFYFKPGDKQPSYVKFGKHGDYEDVTVIDGVTIAVLRSDGSIFSFYARDIRQGGKLHVDESLNVLPQGEYEGLYGDSIGKAYALCKDCKQDDQRDEVSVYELYHQKDGHFTLGKHFTIDVSNINLAAEQRKKKFHPSCLARHPITREWYIISSVNKVLLVLDRQWKLKSACALDPALFKQPEGLAFDSRGNMYISNEGGDGQANVLLYKFNQPK